MRKPITKRYTTPYTDENLVGGMWIFRHGKEPVFMSKGEETGEYYYFSWDQMQGGILLELAA